MPSVPSTPAFSGTLTADAEHRFNDVYSSGRVLEAGCNAHGLRKFRDAEDTQPVLAAEGGAFIGAIYGEEEKAQKLGLAGEKLREHRQRQMKPIIETFVRWMDAVEPALSAFLSEARVAEAIEADLSRIVAAALETVRMAGVAPERLEVLYFTGGSTGLSALVDRIAANFPAAQCVRGNRFASVAQGLGLHARALYGPDQGR